MASKSSVELEILDALARQLRYDDVATLDGDVVGMVARGVDRNAVIDVELELLEAASYLVVRSSYVAPIPERRAPVLTDLLVRINIGLESGHFELGVDNTVVFCSDASVAGDLASLADTVRGNVEQLTVAVGAIDEVAFAEATALDALATLS